MQVDMGKFYKASQSIKIVYNLGFPFDGMSGSYVRGKHDESISIGGLWPTTGIGGPGNVNKTTVSRHMTLTVLDRYFSSQAMSYDTESSASPMRWIQLAQRLDFIGGVDLIEEGRLFLTDCTMMYGNEFFEKYKEMIESKQANKKELTRTTAYIDKDGQAIKGMIPTIVECDSISMFVVKTVEDLQDKAELGESGRNIVPLRSAGAKSQMLMEIPILTSRGSAPTIFTAHVGKDIKLDQYAPAGKNLTFIKNGMKFKDVPEKFTFLMNNCWLIYSVEILKHEKGGPEYPLDSDDKVQGDTDLQEIHMTSIRNKAMVSGIPFKLVISQREGVLPELTALQLMKGAGRFGLGGNTQNFFLEIYPEVALARHTVRRKIADDYKLRRAFEICGEMIQIFNFHDKVDANLRCSPKELYDQLTDKGYDWDRLLNTRGYWIFEEDKAHNNYEFLSTMDLLRMRTGEYHPWWYGDVTPKITTKETK